MPLNLSDCRFFGPALPDPFVKFEIERHLAKLSPIPSDRGAEGKALQERWATYRSKLRALGEVGQDIRVKNHVLDPLAPLLGYEPALREDKVRTREGDEDGGWWMPTPDGAAGLRAWSVDLGNDLDAPNQRGRAYRFSPSRVAARVLLAKGERAGLLTDGLELRLLLCDPARPDSHVAIGLGRADGWRGARNVPDSLRLLIALARPKGVAALPELVEAARLSQTTVTRKLREQARNAVRDFVQGVLDEPGNVGKLGDPDLAKTLWEEGLIVVYRLLFVLKMESSSDPSRAFSFATTSLWRNSYSPNTALAPAVTTALSGVDTGGFLEHSLRTLFRLFSAGLESVELKVSPLGGALFGASTTPTLDALHWGEGAVARLLDALLWTPGEKKTERERVHYGSLDVEDLGRVYEALLELEPGISTEPMCRLRRAKLEVVVPAALGAPYRANAAGEDAEDDEPEEEEDDGPKKGKGKTKVAWVEDIPAGKFFLRTGLGRKSSGSYYTPHPFVRFLVQETLGPQVADRSPPSDPRPARILDLKVLDPAMGSGHFLVEACRFLGDALYEACRLCDERAATAEKAGNAALAAELRARVQALPDPNDELLDWLPSRAPEGTSGGLSQRRAEGLCRRLVAVHCLYGVDKNRLAVELAKLSLWLESYAEGLPLTFMDHRLVCGDSLTGPFLEHLFIWPKAGGPIGDDLLTRGLRERLSAALAGALAGVRDLTASVGKDVADLERKATAKARLDEALAPFRALAAAWAGAVMLGDEGEDAVYLRAMKAVAERGALPEDGALRRMIEVGSGGVVYDLSFPEVFHGDGGVERTGGFDAVVGNPPWDAIQFKSAEFLAGFDLGILEAPTQREREIVEARLLGASESARLFREAMEAFERTKRSNDRLFAFQKVTIDGDLAGRQLDSFRVFMERNAQVLGHLGRTGVVVPGAFHANAGAAGVRHLYMERMRLVCCFSFENRRKLFEIDSRFKFAAVVAQAAIPAAGWVARCAFFLTDLDWLFSDNESLPFDVRFVRATGGEHLTMIEATSRVQVEILERLFRAGTPCGSWFDTNVVEPSTSELPMLGGNAFVPVDGTDVRVPSESSTHVAARLLPLHEGKTLHQFDDLWPTPPRYLVRMQALEDRPRWLKLFQYFRFGYREVSNGTNERTAIAAIMPPPTVSARTVASDLRAADHPAHLSLQLCAVFNCFSFDFALRATAQAHVTMFLVRRLPFPTLSAGAASLLAHSALRLTCNHAGFAPLWTEQVGDEWRGPTPKHTWPVLAGDDARWAVRAAVDAVVADAYGLTRAQYAHVLGSFSHKSYPKAPALCLAAFDELKSTGLDAFVRKHDPYHDVPLNEALPKPVMDFGVAVPAATQVPAEPPAPPWSNLPAAERTVLLLTLLLDRARSLDKLREMGATKVEKFNHLADAHLGIGLDREPRRRVAGPDDSIHRKRAFEYARKNRVFDAQPMLGQVRFTLGAEFDPTLVRARALFADRAADIDKLAGFVASLPIEYSEIVSTLFAAWNDLLRQGRVPDDEAIIAEFFAWHPEKAKHDRIRLPKALAYMRANGIVPTGRAKPTIPLSSTDPE